MRVSSYSSTLDRELLNFIHARKSDAPRVSDNVGLGMARAAAIVRILRTDTRLNKFEILPLSAGQMVDLGGRLADGASSKEAVRERRRIEIRVRRSHN